MAFAQATTSSSWETSMRNLGMAGNLLGPGCGMSNLNSKPVPHPHAAERLEARNVAIASAHSVERCIMPAEPAGIHREFSLADRKGNRAGRMLKSELRGRKSVYFESHVLRNN